MKLFQCIIAVSVFLLTAITQLPNAEASNTDGVAAVLAASALIVTLNGDKNNNEENKGLTFVPSFGYEQKRLSFQQNFNAAAGGTHAKFDVTLPTANVSFTTSFRKMSFILKYETSLAEGTTAVDETVGPLEDRYYFNIPGGVTKVQRDDISATLAYNIVGGLNGFLGYMKGETEIRPDIGCSWDAYTAVAQTCDVDYNPAGLMNLAWVQNVLGEKAPYRQNYTEEGPFIGFSYSWLIADAGTLSLSGAYAKMDGEYTDNHLPNLLLNFGYTGDSIGTSFGLTWAAPLGESSNYFIDFREQKYSMDAKDSTGNFAGTEVKTKETMQGVTAGVQLYF